MTSNIRCKEQKSIWHQLTFFGMFGDLEIRKFKLIFNFNITSPTIFANFLARFTKAYDLR